ncbi:hypothetical protein MKW98_031122 [Papaver atlanticum]|uniref:Ribosome biogenesis protein BMS1/TSR1 C-terminal domain-containing protein n=1 Tax=Papaver atlanticum TaxID=357466 RepID=A0AAD4SWU1_9MAGN|nr:hypothetical protein MKW98_031122 [Papaver atlanticum]
MVAGSSSSSDNQREDRIIEPGLEHVKVYITNKKKSKYPASIYRRIKEEEERPPYIIVVHGPPKVGKSSLIKSLYKYYSNHDEADVRGPPDDYTVLLAFRILATAVVLDYNHAAKIFKKCKRVGTPSKIINKTAFIKDLFTSDLEIDRLKDHRILTKSGIPGKIKKAADKDLVNRLELKEGVAREGITECTFKHNIHMSDIVILHVWKQVEVSQFFNPLMIALDPGDCIWEHSVSRRMLPVDVLPVSKDSINKEQIEEENLSKNRQTKEFLRKLEEKKKAKAFKEYPVGSRRTLEQRRRVIIVEGEPSVRTFPKVGRKCSQVN